MFIRANCLCAGMHRRLISAMASCSLVWSLHVLVASTARHCTLADEAFRWVPVAGWGDTSGRGLRNQVGGIQELVFDVRWGSVAPRAAVGGARVAQVTNSPTAKPLTDLCV